MFTDQTSEDTALIGQTQSFTPSRKTRQTFTFRIGSTPNGPKQVFAQTYQQAANIVAKQLYGKHAYARRLEGVVYLDDFCGYFQAWTTVGHRGACKHGEPFYVQKIDFISRSMAAAAAKP
jgi:hypothetical protein